MIVPHIIYQTSLCDNQYYYVFRALNIDDQTEIDRGITANNGVIQKVITNKKTQNLNCSFAIGGERRIRTAGAC